jgi:hypothetical protein
MVTSREASGRSRPLLLATAPEGYGREATFHPPDQCGDESLDRFDPLVHG